MRMRKLEFAIRTFAEWEVKAFDGAFVEQYLQVLVEKLKNLKV